MSSSGRWRSVDFAAAGAPKLLLKSAFSSTGYQIQLTDLCRVWSENLNKRDIIRRAWDDGCCIDPSEDDEQLNIFQGKVEGALNGDNGTSMALVAQEDDSLSLQLSAPLPEPLPTLKWTVTLARKPEEAVGNVLTVPLLNQASHLQTQVQQLISELHEKDRVISKITDRLETPGNDLTTVFPGVSNIKTNKKKTQREQLARHVKGLADFDESAWRDRSSTSQGSDIWTKIDGVLHELPEPESSHGGQLGDDLWWKSLGTARKSERSASPNPSPVVANAKSTTPALSKEESMVDEDFQRQSTPEHLERKGSVQSNDTVEDAPKPESPATRRPQPVQQEDGDSTTEDEDDLDAAPKHKVAPTVEEPSTTPDSSAHSAGPSKKLGGLGERSSKPPYSPAKEASSEKQTTPEEQAVPPKARAKLGALGGKSKAPSKATPEPAPEDAAPSSAPRKMGVIGGKRKPSTSVPAAATSPKAISSPEPKQERSRAPTKEPTPPPRETSQERADKKRDQLKRELEQKAKAPVKKKRKF